MLVTDVVSKCRLGTNHHMCLAVLLRAGELGGIVGCLSRREEGCV